MTELPKAGLAAFFAAATAYPDKVALSALTLSGAERWSYSRLAGLVYAASEAFKAEGLHAGDRLPFIAEQALTVPLGVMAAQMIEAQPVFAEDGRRLDLANLSPLAPPQGTLPQVSPYQPADRCALIGAIHAPLALAMIFSALGSGATVLCASAKVSIAQMPILLRRHDVSVIAGHSDDLEVLLEAKLTPWPKLRETHCLDKASPALISGWKSRMGHAPIPI